MNGEQLTLFPPTGGIRFLDVDWDGSVAETYRILVGYPGWILYQCYNSGCPCQEPLYSYRHASHALPVEPMSRRKVIRFFEDLMREVNQ